VTTATESRRRLSGERYVHPKVTTIYVRPKTSTILERPDVTRIQTPAPAKAWTNEGTHTRLNPPHKGPLHIPPAHCTTVAARAVLLDTRTTKAARKV